MNAERLLQHFERIADAPDAIARLRRFTLDLAVRGKLVPQDPNDEPASELLKRIAKERTGPEAVKKARRKGETDVSSLRTDTALPVGWLWTNIDEIALSMRYGTSTKCEYAAPGVPVLRIPNVSDGVVSLDDVKFGPLNDSEIRDLALNAGDLLMIRSNGSLDIVGRSAVVTAEAGGMAFAGYLVRLRMSLANIKPEYIWLSMNSTDVRDQIERPIRSAVGLKNVNLTEFGALTIPLPPLAEQHRIVAKVDALMALCDRLEAAQAARENTRDRLAAASLACLGAPDPETFQADARFALEALPALTTRPDQIKRLRQTILNLAVRGKLVPQDPNDQPASELLKRIAKEKAQLVKAGAIPARKEPVRDQSRLTDELPALWSPIALGEVCNLVTSGSRGWAEFYAASGPGFIRAQNIRFGKLRLDDLAFVNPPSNSEGSRTQVAKGDLLIVITGAGVTNPALLDHDPGEAYVSQHVGLVRPSDQRVSAWMLLCLMADAGGRAELVERAYGAGKPGLNLDNIRSLSIPLPPLSEQHRIVAKVDALMALCDRLEASLDLTATTRRRLLDALLAEALAPVDENAIGMKTAEFQLEGTVL